jgi:cytochrome c oxidase assembly protein subunit 15
MPPSPWSHRWAIALACATFPLLWVGGLVTTTDAGMAVPDWPTTYGYNMFLYPWTTWLAAPWDLFVEHGHRLLGAMVGIMSIVLMALVWRHDKRRWMRWLSVAALALVILQGTLGGMRVRHDSRELAMIHGVTGPLFFAVAAAMVVFTSTRWRTADRSRSFDCANQIRWLAVVTCVLIYLQLVIGAVLRHVPVVTQPATFELAVRFHLFMAGIVTVHVLLLSSFVLIHTRFVKPLAGLAMALSGLVLVQVMLGAATWIVKFSVPEWATGIITPGSVAIAEGGWLQTHVITAHVAVGSLLLVTSWMLALYAARLLPRDSAASHDVKGRLGAVV